MLALGSEPRMNIVPGALELAIPFSTLEDALVSQALPHVKQWFDEFNCHSWARLSFNCSMS